MASANSKANRRASRQVERLSLPLDWRRRPRERRGCRRDRPIRQSLGNWVDIEVLSCDAPWSRIRCGNPFQWGNTASVPAISSPSQLAQGPIAVRTRPKQPRQQQERWSRDTGSSGWRPIHTVSRS